MLVAAIALVSMLAGMGAQAEVGYGGGGGGGPATGNGGAGGLDTSCFVSIVPPAEGFSVKINGGAQTVSSHTVQLSLVGGTAARMAISDTAGFGDASPERYQDSRTWTLPPGEGTKTVYVRFYNTCGVSSAVVSASIQVVAPSAGNGENNQGTTENDNDGQVLGEKITAPIDVLIARLRYGQRSDDVRALQTALVNAGLMPRGWVVTNYYGPVTLAAVTRYVDSHPGNLDELIGRLRLGQNHPDVRRLQRLLVSRGLLPRSYRISSYFGTATRNAIVRYQASR